MPDAMAEPVVSVLLLFCCRPAVQPVGSVTPSSRSMREAMQATSRSPSATPAGSVSVSVRGGGLDDDAETPTMDQAIGSSALQAMRMIALPAVCAGNVTVKSPGRRGLVAAEIQHHHRGIGDRRGQRVVVDQRASAVMVEAAQVTSSKSVHAVVLVSDGSMPWSASCPAV